MFKTAPIYGLNKRFLIVKNANLLLIFEFSIIYTEFLTICKVTNGYNFFVYFAIFHLPYHAQMWYNLNIKRGENYTKNDNHRERRLSHFRRRKMF